MDIKVVDSFAEVNAEMEALSLRLRQKEKQFVNEVSEYAFIALRNNMPKKTGETARRIKIEPILTTPLGPERMVHIPPNGKEDSRIPSWLHHGTGVWGPIGRPYHNIGDEPMSFRGKYGFFQRYEIRGQRQNLYWRDTLRTTEAFATIRAYTLFNDLL